MTYDQWKTISPADYALIAFLQERLRYPDHVAFLPTSTKEELCFIIAGEELRTEPHFDESDNVDFNRTAALIDDLVAEKCGI